MFFLDKILPVTIKSNILCQLTNSFRALYLTPKYLKPPALPSNELQVPQQHKAEVFKNIEKLLQQKSEGRLFAVVHICGKQWKITNGDIIIIQGYWPPTVGDKIRLDKVLLAGSNNFTLIGTPILKPELVDVQATVIEKTISHTKTHFRKKRRKQYMRINFYRTPHTMLRINSIEIKDKKLDENSSNKDNLKIF